jgi:chromosome partitioning protein
MGKPNMHTVCVCNQKGGVAKTTTAIHLAAGLALKRKRVLLVDMDPQGHVGSGLGIGVQEHEKSIYDLLMDKKIGAEDVITKSGLSDLNLILANRNLAAAEVELQKVPGYDRRLKKKLNTLEAYDYCIIDSPPSLGTLTITSLSTAEYVLIPTQLASFALAGVSDLLDLLDEINENLERNELNVIGVLPTMLDKRNSTVKREILGDLREYFGRDVLKPIQKSLDIEKCQARNQTIFEFKSKSPAAKSYLQLVNEVMKRVEK